LNEYGFKKDRCCFKEDGFKMFAQVLRKKRKGFVLKREVRRRFLICERAKGVFKL